MDLGSQISNINQSNSKLIRLFDFKENTSVLDGELVVLLISLGKKEDFYPIHLENKEFFKIYFTDREINEYLNKKKKYFWLYGRLLAKTSIIKLLKYSNLNYIPYNAIEILNNSPNRPILNISELLNSKRINFSISHSLDKIVASASFNQIGVDIERIRNFSTRLLKKFLNPKDILKILHFLSNNTTLKPSENEINTTLWCIKEAVSKASGLGLKLDFRKMRIIVRNNETFVKILNQNKKEIYFIKILEEDNYIIAIAKKINKN